MSLDDLAKEKKKNLAVFVAALSTANDIRISFPSKC